MGIWIINLTHSAQRMATDFWHKILQLVCDNGIRVNLRCFVLLWLMINFWCKSIFDWYQLLLYIKVYIFFTGLMFNVFLQSNKDGVINSLYIRNKTKLPMTVQHGQDIVNLYFVENVKIPGIVLSTSSLSTLSRLGSSYFFISSSLNFTSLFI